MGKIDGNSLLPLARKAITEFVRNGNRITPPEEPSEKRGVFCTLKTEHDLLRGCIGFPYPVKPLAEAVVDAAIASSTEDSRFKPVSPDELDEIKIELTILTTPQQLNCPKAEIPDKVTIGVHGLIVENDYTSGLLLPQVATENGKMTPIEFLEATCWKAGLPPHAWKEESTRVYTFSGEIFSE